MHTNLQNPGEGRRIDITLPQVASNMHFDMSEVNGEGSSSECSIFTRVGQSDEEILIKRYILRECDCSVYGGRMLSSPVQGPEETISNDSCCACIGGTQRDTENANMDPSTIGPATKSRSVIPEKD